MIYCFDTSAINRLHDDSDMDSLVSTLVEVNTFRLTALNVIEACGTSHSGRRQSLLQLEKRMSKNVRPLAIPNELLQTLARAHARHESSVIITIDKEHDGIWIALNSPSKVDEVARDEESRWKKGLEGPFTKGHRDGRLEYQRLFGEGTAARPPSASALIRRFCEDNQFIYDVVAPIYKQSTGTELSSEEVRQFLTDVPHWPLYLAGWAHSIYHRAIRQDRYGLQGKPGTIDLWCAVYLPYCDVFVTNDVGQRRALRMINVFNPRRMKIVSYDEFRSSTVEKGR